MVFQASGTTNCTAYNSGTIIAGRIIWSTWASDATTASTFRYTGNVWSAWTTGNETGPIRYQYSHPVVKQPNGRIASLSEYRLQRDRRKASEKGLDLLRWMLTAAELRELRGLGSVRFRGSEGRLYEVGLAEPRVCYRIGEDGKAVLKLGVCQTGREYCSEDRIAAIILAFRSDERAACAKAVVHDLAEREPERVQKRRVFRKVG